MVPKRDSGLETLLDLNGQTIVLDPNGHWVKFVVHRIAATREKPHGLDYSLTLHAPDGTRLAGFDNAHPIAERWGPGMRRREVSDHMHLSNVIRLYNYKDAATLLADFWEEVSKVLKERGGTAMTILRIGIADFDQIKARTMAIARGEHKPTPREPKIWFTSIDSFAKVLSPGNRELLALIARKKPDSLSRLAVMSGRSKSNLSRTLKTMSHYGLVKLEKGPRGAVIPRVPYRQVQIAFSLTETPQKAA